MGSLLSLLPLLPRFLQAFNANRFYDLLNNMGALIRIDVILKLIDAIRLVATIRIKMRSASQRSHRTTRDLYVSAIAVNAAADACAAGKRCGKYGAVFYDYLVPTDSSGVLFPKRTATGTNASAKFAHGVNLRIGNSNVRCRTPRTAADACATLLARCLNRAARNVNGATTAVAATANTGCVNLADCVNRAAGNLYVLKTGVSVIAAADAGAIGSTLARNGAAANAYVSVGIDAFRIVTAAYPGTIVASLRLYQTAVNNYHATFSPVATADAGTATTTCGNNVAARDGNATALRRVLAAADAGTVLTSCGVDRSTANGDFVMCTILVI